VIHIGWIAYLQYILWSIRWCFLVIFQYRGRLRNNQQSLTLLQRLNIAM